MLPGWRKRPSADPDRVDAGDEAGDVAPVEAGMVEVPVMRPSADAVAGGGKRFFKRAHVRTHATVAVEMERATSGRDANEQDEEPLGGDVDDTDVMFEEATSKSRKRGR